MSEVYEKLIILVGIIAVLLFVYFNMQSGSKREQMYVKAGLQQCLEDNIVLWKKECK